MGKGDLKTRRGKIVNKSYGRRRLKKRKNKPVTAINPELKQLADKGEKIKQEKEQKKEEKKKQAASYKEITGKPGTQTKKTSDEKTVKKRSKTKKPSEEKNKE